MRKAKKILALILMAVLPFMLSCGGGGGGGGPAQPETTLTSGNARQASGAAVQSARLVLFTGAAEAIGPASLSLKTYSKDLRKPPLRSILDKVISISKAQRIKTGLHSQGSMQTTELCSNGGTITVSATWIGPDDPTDPSQIVNFDASMSYNSCKEDTSTLNGSMSVAFEGPLSRPTKITISMPNFSYVDTEANDNITITNLTMVVTNLTFTEDREELISGTIILTGSVSGSVDGDPINVECDGYMIVFSSGVTGETLSISGRIKPSCLGSWVTVTTNIPIFVPEEADCPIAGEIIITSGGNSVKVVIASDSKIAIYFNDTLVQTYNDCEEVDGLCGG